MTAYKALINDPEFKTQLHHGTNESPENDKSNTGLSKSLAIENEQLTHRVKELQEENNALKTLLLKNL